MSYYRGFVFRKHRPNKLESNIDTGYVIPQPEIINVSKGNYSGEIHLNWSDYGEDVDYYRISRYDNAAMSGDPFVITSNEASYVDSNIPIGVSYYYTVASVKGNTVSLYETEFGTETNNLPVEEPINRGYAFDTTPIRDNVVIKELADPQKPGFVAPYITVTFPANPSASSYTIQSAMDDFEYPVTYEVKGKLTTPDDGDIYTNGKVSTEVGYVAYDAKAETITINTDAGILDSDLEIKEINIFGNGVDSSLRTNQVDILTNNANRNPNALDYINMFNEVLSETLTEADNGLKGSWSVSSLDDHNPVIDKSYSIGLATYWVIANEDNRVTISLNDRKNSGKTISVSTLKSLVFSTSTNAAGLLVEMNATLLNLSPDNGNEDIITKLDIISSVTVDGRMLDIQDANIRTKSVNVRENDKASTGTYWVTPYYDESSMGTEVMVDISQDGIGGLIPYHANIGWIDR